jgi:CheY-like chemotaxis protein
VLALARRTVSETIELSLELGADLWRCCVDPAQLQSAVLNLVINARDAMPGAGRVTIAARNETVGSGVPDLAAGDYVRLSVADTGSGMAPEVVARVFEPFFTTKGVGKGSGLGLSMVYGFAKQSGGTVRIESAPGRGTTVQLYLPRTTRMPARAEHVPPRPMPRAERPATVLIVEDEEDVRQLVAESLEEFGYRVLLAENAPAAVSVLERDTVDLLLSDIVMPGGMSGLELADRARRLRGELPVLLTTGYAEAIDHATARETGIELLRKPFRPRELGAKIHQMLSAAAGE